MMMLPRFLKQYDNIIVWDFEFASIGGEIKPTSVAYKNILRKNSKTKFLWLRDKDGSVKTETPFDFEQLYPSTYRDEKYNEKTLFVSVSMESLKKILSLIRLSVISLPNSSTFAPFGVFNCWSR